MNSIESRWLWNWMEMDGKTRETIHFFLGVHVHSGKIRRGALSEAICSSLHVDVRSCATWQSNYTNDPLEMDGKWLIYVDIYWKSPGLSLSFCRAF